MVMTHKNMIAQKKLKFYVKESDPSRKFMSKEDALAKNKRIIEDRYKIESYAETLKKERSMSVDVVNPVEEKTVSQDKIQKLEDSLLLQKGPGSKARKDKIQAKIDELKAGGDSNP